MKIHPPPTMTLQRNLQESNDKQSKEIKTEIGGLKNKIDESNADMSTKINGLKATMDKNNAEFKKEITRIDKRLDDHENKTTNIIERAIAEAIAANDAKRDAERDALIERRIANTPRNNDVDVLATRIKDLEDERRDSVQPQQPVNRNVEGERDVEEVEQRSRDEGVVVDNT